MSKRTGIISAAVLLALVAGHLGVRSAYGRDRPDLAAWMSFDDGLWAYQYTFRNGAVGPFIVGQSRNDARKQLEGEYLFDHDRQQVAEASGDWRIALPAQSGGYVIYTVQFKDDQIASIKPYYSVFAGL